MTPRDDSRVHVWLVATAASIVLSLQHMQRVYAIYLAPGDARFSGLLAAVAGLAVGAAVVRALLPLCDRVLPYSLCTLAVCLGASSVGPFAAFSLGVWAPLVASGCLAVTVCSSAVAAAATYQAVARPAIALGLVPFLIRPLRVAFGLLALISVETAAARLGFLRSGLVLGLGIVTLAMAYPPLYEAFYGAGFPKLGLLWGAGVALCTGAFGSLHAAEGWLPFNELSRFSDEVVFRTEASGPVYTVVAAPGGYELFGDGQLVMASLDEHRRSRALVAPALRLSARPRRVLLLNGGLGLVEREILRDGRVDALLDVVPDPRRIELARGLSFVGRRSDHALDSPRLHTVLAEPLAWLSGDRRDRFDVIIADFPWPLGYGEGKFYTHYAFSRLAAHLASDGIVVVPSASGFSAPAALAGVVATLESAGLKSAVYHVAVPTTGMASFVVGSTSLPTVVDGTGWDFGLDLGAPAGGRISTLHDQTVVAAFADAREAESSAPPEP